jgi:replication factor A1
MPIKALGLYQNDWTIKVRLIKKGEKKTFKKKEGDSVLLPLEFVDFEGTQIAATMFGAGVEKHDQILEVMKCYLISGGNVKVANKKYTSIKCGYSLTLDAMSKIQEIPEDSSIPRGGFCFELIGDILKEQAGTMIDVLGVVQTVQESMKIMRKDGTEVDKRQITLCDESGHSIDFALWGTKAMEIFKEGEIIAAKCVKVGDFNGKNIGTVPDSGIFRDPENERTAKLKEWHQNNPTFEGVVALSAKGDADRELSLICEVSKIGSLLEKDSKGKFFQVDVNVEASSYEKGFTYTGCKKCKKKMQTNVCETCKIETEPVPYYMFSIMVTDGTESVWANVFGDTGEALVGKPAKEMLDLKESDAEQYKKIWTKLRNKEYSMILKVRKELYEDKEKERYSVVRLMKSDIKKSNKDLLKKCQCYLEKSN